MKKCLLLLLLLVLAACGAKEAPDTDIADGVVIEETPAPSPDPTSEPTYQPTSQPTSEPDPTPTPEPHISSIPLDGIASFFADLEAVLDRDGGALWGVPLHLPYMFYDQETRHVVANRQDPQGVFMPHEEGVYVGVLPQGARIDDDGINFGGLQWAVTYLWELLHIQSVEDAESALWSMLRQLLQTWKTPLFGQRNRGLYENSHLSGPEQRVLLRTETNALFAAILDEDEESRMEKIHTALSVRAHRRDGLSRLAIIDENDHIIDSGIPQYTAMKLLGLEVDETHYMRPDDEYIEHLQFGFGFNLGLFYAKLLDAIGADWRHNITFETDLGDVLAYHAGIDAFTPIDALDLDRFGYSTISEVEHGWIAFRQGLNDNARALFTGGRSPILWMRSGGASSVSDAIWLNVSGLGRSGFAAIFYGTFTYESEFGTLRGENTFRISDTFDFATELRGYAVSAVDMRIEGNRVTGHGWELELNEGFTIMEVEPGHFWVRRQ